MEVDLLHPLGHFHQHQGIVDAPVAGLLREIGQQVQGLMVLPGIGDGLQEHGIGLEGPVLDGPQKAYECMTLGKGTQYTL